jgi:hypothetical protein
MLQLLLLMQSSMLNAEQLQGQYSCAAALKLPRKGGTNPVDRAGAPHKRHESRNPVTPAPHNLQDFFV